MLADHAQAMRRVCFDAEPSEADLALLGSRERWLIYRKLVRQRLVDVIGAAMPRTKHAVGEEAFGRILDEWLGTGGPKTRYFRYVPTELAGFAIPTWRDKEPAWTAELALYEITAWDVRHAPSSQVPAEEFTFDRPPVLNPALELLRLSYPVHRTPTPSSGYEREPTLLCVYRGKNHRAVPWQLNDLAADLIEGWKHPDQTVTQTVHRVAAAHDTEIGPAFVEKLSTLIAEAITRGIILGGHDPPP